MELHVKLWNQCLSIIKDNVGEPMYSTWFIPIVPLSYVDNNFTIQVPSQFFYEYIEEQFSDLLHKTLNRVINSDVKLLYRIKIDNSDNNDKGSITLPPESSSVFDNRQTTLPQVETPFTTVERKSFDPQLNRNYNFANYIEGVSNRLARCAGLNIAEQPGRSIFNPIFIWGASAVGKTHLANAIGLKVKELYPSYTEEEINNTACYETFQYAVSKLKGAEGTYAEFTVLRGAEEIEMKVQRAKVKTVSVTAKTSIRDPKVGIVSISQFDLTTPTQFKECMDSLIASGCDKFVFDLRNNPGGDLASVTAVLSTLLDEGDVVLSTKDSTGKTEVTKVKVLNYGLTSDYSTCNVSKSDIGKYRGYEMAVLVNENSASAAELFTSALRDHELAQIVGVKTYGKGSMQTIFSLEYAGYAEAVKMTTKMYFPPISEGYDGIGIKPDLEIDLDEALKNKNIYKITDAEDNQIQAAIDLIGK